MFRSIFLPTLVVCLIAAPFLFSDGNGENGSPGNPDSADVAAYQTGYGANGTFLPSARSVGAGGQTGYPFQQASTSLNFQNAPAGHPFDWANGGSGVPATNPANSTGESGFGVGAPPMEFVPAMNLEEIFNFEIAPNWVKNRWKRVSTSPGSEGLHGLRVALVTGTNAWDLHGSLTYYFDQNQRCQRITFRGWTGDASRMEGMLTQKHGFKSQSSHLAGLFLRQSVWETTGALLLKHPTVIRQDNPVQQVAIVFEMNNPQSRFVISEEISTLIKGAQESF